MELAHWRGEHANRNASEPSGPSSERRGMAPALGAFGAGLFAGPCASLRRELSEEPGAGNLHLRFDEGRAGHATRAAFSPTLPAGPGTSRRDGRNAPCSSSTMSSVRLILDRVARQQSPSPLHRPSSLTRTRQRLNEKGTFLLCREKETFQFCVDNPVGRIVRRAIFLYRPPKWRATVVS